MFRVPCAAPGHFVEVHIAQRRYIVPVCKHVVCVQAHCVHVQARFVHVQARFVRVQARGLQSRTTLLF